MRYGVVSDLKLCWSLKIVLTLSAGMDTVTLRTCLLELLTGQDHLCHLRGWEGSEGRNARDT